jgi:HD-like signal output (HDOD) protein
MEAAVTEATSSEAKRILFVDDDPGILGLLVALFQSMGGRWQVFQAESGPAALTLLEREPVDVVVSDMRMPGMDGATFLTEVTRRRPNTVRFILSGYSEQERASRCVGTCHQFLMKPQDISRLGSTLDRVCAMSYCIGNPRLKQLAEGMTVLPSLPSLYFKILKELQSPNSSMARIAEIVSMDPAMTARILQLVNSAFFGIAREVASVDEAVQFLGVSTIRSLALSLHAFGCFERNKSKEMNFERIWHHNLLTGLVARKIARVEMGEEGAADEAFTGGLLHDLGELMLLANLPDRVAEAKRLADADQIPMWQAERQVLGACHAEIGAYLLALWGLPIGIVEAVALHHEPARHRLRTFTPLTAVHVADVLADARTADQLSTSVGLDKAYLAECGLDGDLPTWMSICDQMSQMPAA